MFLCQAKTREMAERLRTTEKMIKSNTDRLERIEDAAQTGLEQAEASSTAFTANAGEGMRLSLV